MGRLLLLAAAVVVLVWLVRRALRGRAPAAPPPAELVACAHCGVLVPRAEAQLADGRAYCGAEHARLGPRPPQA